MVESITTTISNIYTEKATTPYNINTIPNSIKQQEWTNERKEQTT